MKFVDTIVFLVSVMERPPESKKDEQCPLLKIDTGNGEIIRQPPLVQQTNYWSVTCEPKKYWLQKWPELLSISWLTFILLGMSLLVFYALGMAAYRRQPLLVQFNDEKPGSNVFLHHIIHKGCHLSFALYSPFLSLMAHTYPNLRFNVIFLVDDAMRNTYYLPRHTRLSNRLLGYQNSDEILKQEVRELEKRHSNINITIMSLNKYMAITPLRFKWRTIPISYLTFYTRAFAVWQSGGIGMDFTTYNNNFCNNGRLEQRLHEIMKNHNKGLPIADYNVLLQAIDDDEDNSLKCLKQVLNDTISMFNSIFSFGLPTQALESVPSNDTPVTRTQRGKRDGYNFYNIVTSERIVTTDENVSTDMLNTILDEKSDNIKENNSNTVQNSEVLKTTSISSNETTPEADQKPEETSMTAGLNKSSNSSEGPQAFVFYDFSIMSDKVGHFLLREPLWPPLMLSSFGFNPKSETVKDVDKKNNSKGVAQLALDSDGLFIAATDKMHPFLGMLITAGFSRMRPEFAIQDTFITQCSGEHKNESYCNIYRL